MTGFGRYTFQADETYITVEIRSLNHRYLDISVKTRPSMLRVEEQVMKQVRTYFKRGRIDVFIHFLRNPITKKTLKTDWKLLDEYMDTFKQIKKKYGLQGEIPLSSIQALPEVMSIEEIEEESDQFLQAIEYSIHEACLDVLRAREQEGIRLLTDLEKRIEKIRTFVDKIDAMKEDVQQKYQKRIAERMNDYLKGKNIDEDRLYQEMAFFIEKGDITEELTRLKSHLHQFKNHLKTGGVVGRTLDFLTQEMHRETNTIGSKASDHRMSEKVVQLKSEIEKIREQIQNIE